MAIACFNGDPPASASNTAPDLVRERACDAARTYHADSPVAPSGRHRSRSPSRSGEGAVVGLRSGTRPGPGVERADFSVRPAVRRVAVVNPWTDHDRGEADRSGRGANTAPRLRCRLRSRSRGSTFNRCSGIVLPDPDRRYSVGSFWDRVHHHPRHRRHRRRRSSCQPLRPRRAAEGDAGGCGPTREDWA